MRIFKRKRGDSQSRCWYCEFKDHYDVQRRVALYGDKRASEEAGRNLEKVVAYRKARRPLEGEVLAFVEGLGQDMIARLADWGLLDRAQAAAGIPLMIVEQVKSRNGRPAYAVTGGHLYEYKVSMGGREISPRHIVQTMGYCREVLLACGFVLPHDIRDSKLGTFLHELRKNRKSARTVNVYLSCIKAFCNWLVNKGVLPSNPLAQSGKLNESADKRYERRPLSESEVPTLINATLNSGQHHGLSGFERSLVYRLALETGLRWNEIYTLQRRDFDLSASPSVTVRAGNAKNRKEETLPLRLSLAKDIANYFGRTQALPATRVFVGMWKQRGARMLELDLEAAGIEKENGQGLVDFHSLRHTFGTLLAKAGVAPKVAMDLMRHSDVNLTMGLYSHTVLQDRASAIEKLPEISSGMEEFEATGTDNIYPEIPQI